jgi:hypothetical protein
LAMASSCLLASHERAIFPGNTQID